MEKQSWLSIRCFKNDYIEKASIEPTPTKTYTFRYTANDNANWDVYFVLPDDKVKDGVNNASIAITTTTPVVVDTMAPILSEKTVFEDIWYTWNHISYFTYTDNWVGINEWENITQCTISEEWTESVCEVTDTYICDKVWNCNTEPQTSNPIKLDKTAPVFTGKTVFEDIWYNTGQESIFTYEDTVSWISGSATTTCIIDTEWESSTCTTQDTRICNNAWLCNTENQTSNSIKLDMTNPTCTITWNSDNWTNQDVVLTLNYDEEVNPISDWYSWNGVDYSSVQIFTGTINWTYTWYVKDIAWNTGSCSVEVTKIDKTRPEANITSTNTPNSLTQTATLSCSDEEWVVSYYWWEKNNPENSDYIPITISSSFSTWKTVETSGTYYLFCKDGADNISSDKNVTYVKYQVKNMLDTVEWNTGTYNTVNYDVDTTKPTDSTYYILPKGTDLALSSLCTAPNTPSTLQITSKWMPDSTEATSLDNDTINSGGFIWIIKNY